VPSYSVAADDLRAYAGRYVSDEAETVLTVAVEGGALVVKRRPDTVLKARPAEKDAFDVPGMGTVAFHRDATGHITELSIKVDRVWDLRFTRER
jgi:hypothetical protein